MNRESPIGVFDSGIGGLTVLGHLQKALPHENFIYVADTAHLPYGDKQPDQILSYVTTILSWMTSQSVKLAIMACNTSSALLTAPIESIFPFQIIGLIEPTARAIAPQYRRLGVMSTLATKRSHAYEQTFARVNPSITLHVVACPPFVPLIEEGKIHEPSTRLIVQDYLSVLIDDNIEGLIYGCTHYPYLDPLIQGMLPVSINRIDPASFTTQAASSYLIEHDLLHQNNTFPQTSFYTSGDPVSFSFHAGRLLHTPVTARKICFEAFS